MGGYYNLNIQACLFKLARDGGFAEIVVYAQCTLFEVKVRLELPESLNFKHQEVLWFCAVQVHTCQEGYCTRGFQDNTLLWHAVNGLFRQDPAIFVLT